MFTECCIINFIQRPSVLFVCLFVRSFVCSLLNTRKTQFWRQYRNLKFLVGIKRFPFLNFYVLPQKKFEEVDGYMHRDSQFKFFFYILKQRAYMWVYKFMTWRAHFPSQLIPIAQSASFDLRVCGLCHLSTVFYNPQYFILLVLFVCALNFFQLAFYSSPNYTGESRTTLLNRFLFFFIFFVQV